MNEDALAGEEDQPSQVEKAFPLRRGLGKRRACRGTMSGERSAPEDRYSKRIGMDWIAEEGYNLNICRYISTAKGEEEIELAATRKLLIEIGNRSGPQRRSTMTSYESSALPFCRGRNDLSPKKFTFASSG